MKTIIADLKDARINILASKRKLELKGGYDSAIFELQCVDPYLEEVILFLQASEKRREVEV